MAPARQERSPWLDPRLALQLAVLLVSLAGVFFGLRGQVGDIGKSVTDLQEKQGLMGTKIEAIRDQLPNRELQERRFTELETKNANLEARVKDLEIYNQDLRERLAAKGWRP